MTARPLPSHMLQRVLPFLRVVPLMWVLGAVVPAVAAETSLRLIVPSYSYGGTDEFLFTPEDGEFTVYRPFDHSIQVEFSDPSFTNRWSLSFAAAQRQPLAAGTY